VFTSTRQRNWLYFAGFPAIWASPALRPSGQRSYNTCRHGMRSGSKQWHYIAFLQAFFSFCLVRRMDSHMAVNSIKSSIHVGCLPAPSGSGRLWTHGFRLVTHVMDIYRYFMCKEPLLVGTCCGELLTIPHFFIEWSFLMKIVIYSIFILLYFVICKSLYTSILAVWIVRIQHQAPI
jgi:hypothetical protein